MPNKVMVVEDDELLRTLTAAMIEECGFEAIEAEDGDQAQNLLAREGENISAVMTDVRMPGEMDGMALANWITGRWPHIRVLVTSAFAESGRAPPGIQFMPKPWLSLEVIKFVLQAEEQAGSYRH